MPGRPPDGPLLALRATLISRMLQPTLFSVGPGCSGRDSVGRVVVFAGRVFRS